MPRSLSTLLLVALAASAAAGDELCLTGNARRNQNLRMAFTVQPERAKPLFDGSHLDRNSVGFPQPEPVVLSFAEPARVGRATLVVYNDPPRTYNAAGRARVVGRRGGAVVVESPWVSLDADAVTLCGTDDALVLGSQAEVPLPQAGAVDSISVEIEKRPGAVQCLVREVQLWGIPERLAGAPIAPIRPRVRENTCSSIRVAWDALPAGAAYARVRWRPKGTGPWNTVCFTQSPGLLFWLRPDALYEVAAEAVGMSGPAGGGPAVGPSRRSDRSDRSDRREAAHRAGLRVALAHPLALRRMSDAFGMNHYPGGGGAHQRRPNETENTHRMVALMRDAGVRHVRWWVPSPGFAEILAENGMTLFPTATSTEPAYYERLARTTGVWLTATANEPDYGNVFAGDFTRAFLPRCEAARRYSPLMLVAGPAVGGELVGPGSDYLSACYAAGLKDAVDVLDIHPYAKRATPTPPGGVLGGPEGLLASVSACKETMRKAGDAARPLIASESGHPTYEGNWHMPASSYERQAQWVVRTHLLLVAAGVRRVYWYAFQDEGTDKKEPEHCFGLVDWHGRPKPSYRSYSVMTRILGDTRCLGMEAGVKAPVYAVRCATQGLGERGNGRVGDGEAGAFVTPIWDSGGRSEVRVGADAGVTRVVSLMGEELALPAREGKSLVLAVDEDVRYLFSRRPLRFRAQKRLDPPLEPQVQMTLSPTTVRVERGRPARWTARLANGYPCAVKVSLGCAHPWGGKAPAAAVVLPPRGRTEVPMEADTPADAKPGIVSWDVTCRVQPEDTRYKPDEFRRAIFFEVPATSPAK